jgi:hypothetical protein
MSSWKTLTNFFGDESTCRNNCGCIDQEEGCHRDDEEVAPSRGRADAASASSGGSKGAELTHHPSFADNSLALTERASRSLSSSFSFFGNDCSSIHNLDGRDGSRGFHNNTKGTCLFPSLHCNSNDKLLYTYYSPQDFETKTWLTAISETISIHALAGGATVVLGAVVIVHPVVLVGAATAAGEFFFFSRGSCCACI